MKQPCGTAAVCTATKQNHPTLLIRYPRIPETSGALRSQMIFGIPGSPLTGLGNLPPRIHQVSAGPRKNGENGGNGGKWGKWGKMGGNGGKWGKLGGNGGKWGEMGGNGELLQKHDGKCMKMFQEKREMGGNGVEMGEKWVKTGTCSGNFPIFPKPSFPEADKVPSGALYKSWSPVSRVEEWGEIEVSGGLRKIGDFIGLLLFADIRRNSWVFVYQASEIPGPDGR